MAAIGTALAIGWISRRGNLRGDTAIGVLFAGMFSLGVFLFSTIHNYVGDLFGLLFGEVLGIGAGRTCWPSCILAGIVLVVVACSGRSCCTRRSTRSAPAQPASRVVCLDYLFLALIAMTIVVSLQAVGIILVVAMLVTPAATAQLLTLRFGRLIAIAVRHRGRQPGRGPVPVLLDQLGERRDDRPRGDGDLPRRPAARSADRRLPRPPRNG